ncbi:MAG: tat pathway signal sequence domain protein [Saprospiraceae bacterium]|nr:tat pathway signal sequence domain protein [Saprospiraceae bacterium]
MYNPRMLVCFLLCLLAQSAVAQTAEYVVNVNAEGLILEGYDAVSIRDGHPLKGLALYSTRYHGAVYRFASGANQARFDADPARYEPAFGGFCAYGVATGALVGIDLSTYDTSFQGLNIYNLDRSIARKWKKDPAGYYRKALAKWPELVAKRKKKR